MLMNVAAYMRGNRKASRLCYVRCPSQHVVTMLFMLLTYGCHGKGEGRLVFDGSELCCFSVIHEAISQYVMMSKSMVRVASIIVVDKSVSMKAREGREGGLASGYIRWMCVCGGGQFLCT